MKKLLLAVASLAGFWGLQAQYYNYATLNAGENPNNLNKDGENPYPATTNVGWSALWNGGATSALTYTSEQMIPFPFKFNGSSVTKYTVGNFGTVSFDAGTPSVKPNGYSNISLPSSDIPDNSVCILGLEPISVTSGSTTFSSAVMTKTFGTAPNRQHWIWFNFYGQSSTLKEGWTYWAVVLEETSNHIYIVDMKTLPVQGGNLIAANVKLSAGIQINSTSAYTVNGSPNLGAQQVTQNVFDASDNSYYTFVQGSQPMNDIWVKSVVLDKYMKIGDAPFDIAVNVRNVGSAVLNAADVHFSINGGMEVGGTMTSSANLGSLNSGKLTSPAKWTPSATGKYTVKVWTSNPNGSADPNTYNDTASFVVEVVDRWVQRKMLNEVFSSSTCAPCRPGNVNYKTVTEGRDNHTSIKYQVWWPGTGDPYCTNEVRTRASFYGVNSVPRMQIDGGWDGNAGLFTGAMYENQEKIPSFLEISGVAANAWKNTISLDVELNPLVDFPSTNLRLFAAILEGETKNNKKSNGETEFEMVMKKMMPGAAGTNLSAMTKGTKVNRTLSHTFQGPYRLPLDGQQANHIKDASEHSVETFDDLYVVVWVQDNVTKEILQSEKIAVNNASKENVEAQVKIFPNPSNEAFQLVVDRLASEKAKVQIMNIQGQVVFDETMNNGKLEINTSAWSTGVYMLTVEGSNYHYSTKVMVRH
jgi:hypothetical protein